MEPDQFYRNSPLMPGTSLNYGAVGDLTSAGSSKSFSRSNSTSSDCSTSSNPPTNHPSSLGEKDHIEILTPTNITTEALLGGECKVYVISSVGSGYAGTVYKCCLPRDEVSAGTIDSDVVFALKVMPKDKTKARVALNEATLLRAASDENVLAFLGSIESIDAYWIMTEYCSGGDLHGRLLQLDNNQIMARKYMYDVIAGLESMHRKLIVHADIKMKNILITDQNVAKIGDFGFAKQYKSKDARECVCHGTRDYWAPEMFNHTPNYNPFKADIYALGVTFVGVLERRPIKLKNDNIKHVINRFRDLHQYELFRGLLNVPEKRWTFSEMKSNLWLIDVVAALDSPS